MANFILKPQNSKFSEIRQARLLIGTASMAEDSSWTARIAVDGVTTTVTGFASATSAFYAVTMAHKIKRLNVRHALSIPATLEGSRDERAEMQQREQDLAKYVQAFNRVNEGGVQLRIQQKRVGSPLTA